MTGSPLQRAHASETILLRDFVAGVESTDRFGKAEIQPIVLGLFGEVGSVMSAVKKHKREGVAFVGFRQAVEEEFGDALWYLTALCRRLNVEVEEIFAKAAKIEKYGTAVAAIKSIASLDDVLLALGRSVASLIAVVGERDAEAKLIDFADCFLAALQSSGVSFAEVIKSNVAKTRGRFLTPDHAQLPTFDSFFPRDEQIPQDFEIVIGERKSGQSYLQMNGVFIGDPLTDNIFDKDGYRFHDVFHFAHAAVLHWSPTFRALIKHKRKSDPAVDEAQDSGRAIVVEEGLSAWIFSRAKKLSFFEGQSGVSFDLLKTISEFVSGYEVDACPLKLWEDAVIQGYEVFRLVRANNGGIVIGSRANRKIVYNAR